jgi:hypothetical protein
MPLSEYLRQQAENCLRIARQGFDLATAERLRHMAAELEAKADELEEAEDEGLSPHLMGNGNGYFRNGSSDGEADRE